MSYRKEVLEGHIGKLFLKYTAASVSGMLMISVYILFDTMFIGWGLGSEGLAALSMILPLFCVLFGLGMLFGMGGSTVMSIYIGQKDEHMAKVAFTHALGLMTLFGTAVSVGGVVWIDQICVLLGATADNMQMVKDYAIYLMIFGFSFIGVNALTILIRNDGAPRWSMMVTAIGGILNIVLDYVFIFPMQMGMKGGAIATVISSLTSLTLLILYLAVKSRYLKLVATRIQLALIRRIFRNGAASFIIESSSGMVIFAFNRVILEVMGVIGVSAYSIIANVTLIYVAIFTGVAQGVQPLLSVHFGAGSMERIHKIKGRAYMTVLGLGILFAGVGFLFPEAIVGLFSERNPQLMEITVKGIYYSFGAFLLTGINIVAGSYKQSIEMPFHSTIISMSRGVVLVLLGLMILPVFLGEVGIWLTIPFSEMGTFLLLMLLPKPKHSRLDSSESFSGGN